MIFLGQETWKEPPQKDLGIFPNHLATMCLLPVLWVAGGHDPAHILQQQRKALRSAPQSRARSARGSSDPGARKWNPQNGTLAYF